MAETPTRKPWERQPGEQSRPFAAFCYCRDLSEGRTIRQGVMVYLTGPCPERAPSRARQQRRYQQHDRPEAYVNAVRGQWRRWSVRFHWVERWRAYDEYAAAEAEHRSFEAQVEQQLSEQKRREAAAKLLSEQTQMVRMVGAGVVQEIGAAIAAGEHKRELTCPNCDAVIGIDRLKLLLPHLGKAAIAFDTGAKHERLEHDKPTDIVRTELSDEQMKRLADIIMARIPEIEWESVATEVAAAIRGERANGHA